MGPVYKHYYNLAIFKESKMTLKSPLEKTAWNIPSQNNLSVFLFIWSVCLWQSSEIYLEKLLRGIFSKKKNKIK